MSTATGKRPAPSSDADDEGAVCYICLDDGPDESGQPLVRDCSCRGNSGWAHLSCTADYAERLCRGKNDSGVLVKAWTSCPNCHQSYEHELAIDLVEKCIAFAEREYPGDLWYQIHVAYLKLRTLAIDQKNKDAAVVTSNHVIALVAQMKERMREDLPDPFLYFEVTSLPSLRAQKKV